MTDETSVSLNFCISPDKVTDELITNLLLMAGNESAGVVIGNTHLWADDSSNECLRCGQHIEDDAITSACGPVEVFYYMLTLTSEQIGGQRDV